VSAPLVRVIEESVSGATTTTLDEAVVAQSPYAGTVTAVQYVPEAAITGAATNNRTLSLVNKGQAGSGTAVVATLTFASGTNATAHNEVSLTLSSTAADLVIAEGDTLLWRSVGNGTGMTDPGGLVRVTVSRS
jgi:hypothetical protein